MPGRSRTRSPSMSLSRSRTRSRSASRSRTRSRSGSSLRSRSRSPLSPSHSSSKCYVVNLRGLPYSATEKDVKRFLGECSDSLIRVEFGSKEGKPDGECWLEFSNSQDCRKALGRHRDFMGKRYIEVIASSPSERRKALNPDRYRGSFILRLRGLPYGISKDEITTFFRGSTIAPNGIIILVDNTGRQVGDAFVNFEDVQSRDRALARDREKIGRRYIEIFKSDQRELDLKLQKFATQQGSVPPYSGGRGGGYESTYSGGGGGGYRGRGGGGYSGSANYAPIVGPLRVTAERTRSSATDYRGSVGIGAAYDSRGGGGISRGYESSGGYSSITGRRPATSYTGSRTRRAGSYDRSPSPDVGHGHFVFIRGMPFTATEKDLKQFFMPLIVKSVHVGFDQRSKPNGEANVEFYSHEDALSAMEKHGSYMGSRYLELQLNSSGGGRSGGYGASSSYSSSSYRR